MGIRPISKPQESHLPSSVIGSVLYSRAPPHGSAIFPWSEFQEWYIGSISLVSPVRRRLYDDRMTRNFVAPLANTVPTQKKNPTDEKLPVRFFTGLGPVLRESLPSVSR